MRFKYDHQVVTFPDDAPIIRHCILMVIVEHDGKLTFAGQLSGLSQRLTIYRG
tara:strand:+ start:3327 stop:3485 length:159 start_codon:yes stop_codon:yes gene_type:complete